MGQNAGPGTKQACAGAKSPSMTRGRGRGNRKLGRACQWLKFQKAGSAPAKIDGEQATHIQAGTGIHIALSFATGVHTGSAPRRC